MKNIPFHVLEYYLFPYLDNGDVLSMKKVCKEYNNYINSSYICDVNCLYIVSVYNSFSKLTLNAFIGRSMLYITGKINDYYKDKTRIETYRYNIYSYKYGNIFSFTDTPIKYNCEYTYMVKQRGSFILPGRHITINCHTLKTWNSISRIFYIFTPSSENVYNLFTETISKFGIKKLSKQRTNSVIKSRYIFY